MIKDVYPQFIPERKKRFVPFEELFAYQQVLQKSIISLSQEEQIILSLHYCEELTFGEIGEVLCQSSEEIRERFCAALEKIREDVIRRGLGSN